MTNLDFTRHFSAEYFDDEYYEELYNLGTSQNTTKKTAVNNNTSSSIADLKILISREIKLMKEVLEHLNVNELNLLLKEDGYDINVIANTDVLNPIDSYNLIKRTSRTWKKIKEILQTDDQKKTCIGLIEKALTEFPMWEDSRIASALGLLNIQLYYDLDPALLMDGKLKDNLRNKTYQAVSKLRSDDVKLIASVAKNENNLKSQITWLRASPELRKQYRKATKFHNNLLAEEPEELGKQSWVVFEDTVDESIPVVEDIHKYIKAGRS